MSAFRAFMIYDYQRNFFMLFIRLGFQVSLKWKDCRKELEVKLVEMIKEPQEMYEMQTDYGRFKCQYDKKNKCYFILLCSQEVNEEKQLEVLAEIYELIQKNPNYQKIKKDELESKQTNTVTKLLTKKEQEYITEFGMVEHFDEPEIPEKKIQMEVKIVSQHSSMQNLSKIPNNNQQQQQQQAQSNIQLAYNKSQLKNHSGFASAHDLNPDVLVKIFRCFMMWDYGRQFFFMFIRRGFPIDRTWSQERYKFEEELKAKMLDPKDPKAKPKEPPEEFDQKGDFGLYKAKYDQKNKCYFILLSRFKTKNDPQVKLLNALYDEVHKVDKYITLKYDILESKIKNNLIKIIEQHEDELTKHINRKFVDPKLFESKFGRIASPEERSGKQQSRIASPQHNQINSSNNLSSKKGSIFMSSGHLLQQYEKQDILAQEQDDIPEFTEQGELAIRLNKYQSAPLQVEMYVKQQN